MIEDAGAWDNYRASYRPLVEFARRQNLPVIAANAPADVVRCVGRKGLEFLNRISDTLKQKLPSDPFMDTPAYREKFMAAIGASHQADNTMATRILQARAEHPEHQVLHTLPWGFRAQQPLPDPDHAGPPGSGCEAQKANPNRRPHTGRATLGDALGATP